MSRRSQIFRGEVVHERLGPKPHRFAYPMTFFDFDLSELPKLHAEASLFGYNKSRPLSIRDSDYLYGESRTIREQLDCLLPPEEAGQSTRLISSPRFFGYAFNPVNFHLRMQGDVLLCAVAEVNNTFGDRHVYPLKELERVKPGMWTARCAKDFHVSPFNDMSGEYHFSFRIERDKIYLGVDLYKGDACVMKTWIRGRGREMTNRNIRKYAFRHPFDTALNSMPRIIWQAALLHYGKKMEVFRRPSPESAATLVDRDRKDAPNQVI